MIIRRARIALIASIGAASIACAGLTPARAESVQKECGEEWAAAKKAGTVTPGQAWPGFLSECRKRHANGATTAPTTPATTPVVVPSTPVTPPKTEVKTEAKTDTRSKADTKKADAKKAETTTAATGDLNETCKAEYAAGKASGAVVKGTNYFKYLSECKKRHAGDTAPAGAPATSTATAPTTPTAPATTTTAPATTKTATPTTTAEPTTTDGKKPLSAGRQAFVERERTCGAKWKTIKGTAGLPAGITTWPKYLSYCNTRLKQNLPI